MGRAHFWMQCGVASHRQVWRFGNRTCLSVWAVIDASSWIPVWSAVVEGGVDERVVTSGRRDAVAKQFFQKRRFGHSVENVPMNENHARLCPSPEWAAHLHTDVLPAVTDGFALGPRMLEIGPGPGASADWLRERVDHLVTVEIDEATVTTLRKRFAGTNVHIIQGDATALPFDDASFDGAGSFTMLHHVPSATLQNQVLAEVLRVLKPGATLFCSDSLPSSDLHEFHVGDVYNPIDPATLISRLQTIGFGAITLSVDHVFTFRASKPDPTRDGIWNHGK